MDSGSLLQPARMHLKSFNTALDMLKQSVNGGMQW